MKKLALHITMLYFLTLSCDTGITPKYHHDAIIFIAEMKVNNKTDQEVETFCQSYQERVDRTEPNTLAWTFFKSGPDRVTLFEHYASEEAMKTHVKNVSPNGISKDFYYGFNDHFTVELITVYGTISEEFKNYLLGFNMPLAFKPLISGYSRN